MLEIGMSQGGGRVSRLLIHCISIQLPGKYRLNVVKTGRGTGISCQIKTIFYWWHKRPLQFKLSTLLAQAFEEMSSKSRYNSLPAPNNDVLLLQEQKVALQRQLARKLSSLIVKDKVIGQLKASSAQIKDVHHADIRAVEERNRAKILELEVGISIPVF